MIDIRKGITTQKICIYSIIRSNAQNWMPMGEKKALVIRHVVGKFFDANFVREIKF